MSLMMLVLCLFLSFDDHNHRIHIHIHNHKQTNKESNSLNIVPIHSFSHGPVSLSVKSHNLLHSSTPTLIQAAGPFYTARRECLSQILASFKSRGFHERQMVTLLGVHSIGEIHCEFFQNRLYNFNGTNEPDHSLDTEFLNLLRSRCNHTDGSVSSVEFKSTQLKSSASSLDDELNFDQLRSDFGILYYHSLLDGKGILYADQQLTEGEKTKHWVKEYAFHPTLFHQDFALAMMKLSDLRVLTLPMGNIWLNCTKVA